MYGCVRTQPPNGTGNMSENYVRARDLNSDTSHNTCVVTSVAG